MPRVMHKSERPMITRSRRESDVPDTPEAREHAQEADRIRQELLEFGIDPEKVSPTLDCRGHVRLNFDQVRKLLGL